MTLLIDLPPEIEARLVEAAKQRSQSVQQLACELLALVPEDPFRLALLLADKDDEPVSDEDLADIDATLARMEAATGLPHAEIRRRVLSRE